MCDAIQLLFVVEVGVFGSGAAGADGSYLVSSDDGVLPGDCPQVGVHSGPSASVVDADHVSPDGIPEVHGGPAGAGQGGLPLIGLAWVFVEVDGVAVPAVSSIRRVVVVGRSRPYLATGEGCFEEGGSHRRTRHGRHQRGGGERESRDREDEVSGGPGIVHGCVSFGGRSVG